MNLPKKVATRWVQSRIILPPRKLEPYIRLIKKKLLPFESHLEKLKAIDKKYDRDFRTSYGEDNPMDEFSLHGNDWYDFKIRLNRLNSEYSQRAKSVISERLENVDQAIKFSKEGDTHNFLKWLGYAINDFERLKERLDKATLDKRRDEEGFSDWVDQKSFYVEEGVPFPSENEIRLIAGYEENLQKCKRVLEEALERLNRISEQAYGVLYDKDWKPPEIEEIETLYHATIHAVPLSRTGFSLKVPETEGIGGSQGDKRGRPAISFTSDLYVANQVARALKEAVMIAKGKLKLHQIRDWARREGILDEVDSTNASVHGRQSDPVWGAFNYYTTYLAYSKRYNPVFFGITNSVMNKWKRTNESNIGVVAADVNMSNPDISYLSSMQEYRVPPEAVLRITKVIR